MRPAVGIHRLGKPELREIRGNLLEVWTNAFTKSTGPVCLEVLDWEDTFVNFVLKLFHDDRKKVKHFLECIHTLCQYTSPRELTGRAPEYQGFWYMNQIYRLKFNFLTIADNFNRLDCALFGPTPAPGHCLHNAIEVMIRCCSFLWKMHNARLSLHRLYSLVVSACVLDLISASKKSYSGIMNGINLNIYIGYGNISRKRNQNKELGNTEWYSNWSSPVRELIPVANAYLGCNDLRRWHLCDSDSWFSWNRCPFNSQESPVLRFWAAMAIPRGFY